MHTTIMMTDVCTDYVRWMLPDIKGGHLRGKSIFTKKMKPPHHDAMLLTASIQTTHNINTSENPHRQKSFPRFMGDYSDSGLEIRATKIPHSRFLPKIHKDGEIKLSRSLDSIFLPKTSLPPIANKNNGRAVYRLSLSESTDLSDLHKPRQDQQQVTFEYLEPVQVPCSSNESRPHSIEASDDLRDSGETKRERRKNTKELLRRAIAKLREVEAKYLENQIHQVQKLKHCKRLKKLQFPSTELESIQEAGSPVDDKEIQNGRYISNKFQTEEGRSGVKKTSKDSRKIQAKRFLELPPIVPIKQHSFRTSKSNK